MCLVVPKLLLFQGHLWQVRIEVLQPGLEQETVWSAGISVRALLSYVTLLLLQLLSAGFSDRRINRNGSGSLIPNLTEYLINIT